jgi:hypothetical protein
MALSNKLFSQWNQTGELSGLEPNQKDLFIVWFLCKANSILRHSDCRIKITWVSGDGRTRMDDRTVNDGEQSYQGRNQQQDGEVKYQRESKLKNLSFPGASS